MTCNYRAVLFALVLLSLLVALLVQAGKPPRAKGIDASPDQFSAGRAFAVLKDLLGDEKPHPVGSEANARVRDRIVEKLKRLGYEPEVDRVEMEMDKPRKPPLIVVENILCRIPGKTPGPAAMLVAHYDSAPAGPGAADDGVGVAAVLEIARILKRETPRKNPIVLLITDGEERGLWGARAFVTKNPLAKEVAAAVNLKARGTSGRSLMFETGENNAWLVAAYSAAVSSPDTSSFYGDVYRRLPNSTDFTVFKIAGMTGFNFAFIGNQRFYHTAGDNLANLDRGSLQHQGDNALATLRALAEADLAERPHGTMVYTDVLSCFVVRWPEKWTLPLVILAILPLGAVILDLLRKRMLLPRSLLGGLVLSPAIIAVTVLLGAIAMWLPAILPASPRFWNDAPWIMRVLLWSETVAAVVVLTIFVNRGTGGLGLWAGTWLWWAILGLVTGLYLPSASYFFLLPLGAAAVAAVSVWFFRCKRRFIACQIVSGFAALIAGVFWLKTAIAIEDVFGFRFPFAITALLAVVLLTMAPVWMTDRARSVESK